MGESAALARDLIDAFGDDQAANARSPVDRANRFFGMLLLSSIAAIAIVLGLWLRQAAFTHTANLHFEGDVGNAYFWGVRAAKLGVFDLYDQILANQPAGNRDYQLDYPPLRLAIVTGWAHWTLENFTFTGGWQSQYEFNQPMLWLNTACEFVSALLVFLLIRLWKRRQIASRQLIDGPLPQFCGAGTAMIGGLILWFNPALILDSHAWPQWDVWMLPFFLGAVLIASAECWLTAGILLAIGAFLKGQMLLIAPVLILWPIFERKISAAIRLIGGFGITASAIAYPWMRLHHDANIWLIEMLIAIGLLAPFVLISKLHWLWTAPLAAIAALLTWPFESHATIAIRIISPVLLLSLAISRLLPQRARLGWVALCAGVVVFFTIPIFGGSFAWFKIGYGYGAFKFNWMATDGTYCLPWIMQIRYGWDRGPDGLVMLPLLHRAITIRALLATAYAICLLLSAAGAARQSRRNSPRFFAAIIAPSLCFFVLLTMMNNRYLVWAAALTALLPAIGVGMTMLGLLITAICFCGIIEIMYRVHPAVNPPLTKSLGMLQPDLAWPLLLCAAILLWVGLTKSWRDRPAVGLVTART